jgi:hypothetical protein
MPVPDPMYEWATNPGTRVEPPTKLKESGAVPGVPVGSHVFNNLIGRLTDWVVWLSARLAYFVPFSSMVEFIDEASAGEVGLVYENDSTGDIGTTLETASDDELTVLAVDGRGVYGVLSPSSVNPRRWANDLTTLQKTYTLTTPGTMPGQLATNGAFLAVAYSTFLEVFDADTAVSEFQYSHGAAVNACAIDYKHAYLAGVSGTGSNTVRAIQLADGVAAWSYNHGATVYSIVTCGKRIIISGAAGTGSNTMRALDRDTGAVLWSTTTPHPTNGSNAGGYLQADEHRIYVADGGSGTATLKAFSPADGTEIYSVTVPSVSTDLRDFWVDQEFVYANLTGTSTNRRTYVHDKATGALFDVLAVNGGDSYARCPDGVSLYTDNVATTRAALRVSRGNRPGLWTRVDPATHRLNPYGWLALPSRH